MTNNLSETIKLLNDGQYHDGTSIGNHLNITRAAVWKIIKKLEQYGIQLTSIKGKGYMLEESLILLDAKKISSLLTTPVAHIDILEKVDSTNLFLKKNIDGNKELQLCIAETQTAGRGRLNRHWHSPFAKNIYLSLLYPLQKDISALSGLSLVVSLAVCRALETSIGNSHTIAIKWPNDMLIDRQKIAGILIDIQAESNGFCQAIIGIGVNVNLTAATTTDINQPWSSLQKLTGQYYDRNLICAELINQVLAYLELFSEQGLSAFHKEWHQRDCLLGQPVSLISGKESYQGIGAGIDEQGHLLLTMTDGSKQHFSSGDTTLLK